MAHVMGKTVKTFWLFSLVIVGVGVVWLTGGVLRSQVTVPSTAPTTNPMPTPAATPSPTVRYQVLSLPHSTVHSITIPPDSNFTVAPVLAAGLDTVVDTANRTGAIAVINGGFFDPANELSTSFVVLSGKQVADPRQNDRLMQNPDLAPYMNQILNRSEFRRYRCGNRWRYAITPHQAPVPIDCELVDALGGGPQLLPNMTDQTEGFVATVDGKVIRDAIGRDRRNARSAVGITQDGTVIWVMAAQKAETPTSSGLSLPELATILKELGAVQAMNLDGGSSASLHYRGQTFYGKVDNEGKPVQRHVKSVLVLQQEVSH